MNPDIFLRDIKKQFWYYKRLTEQAIDQLTEEEFFYKAHYKSNSIAIIVKHISGNLLSRFTDFKTSDGEKEWRHRDQEFILDSDVKSDYMDKWHRSWTMLREALDSVESRQLDDKVIIRNHEHNISTAILRSVTHIASHVGQILYCAKAIKGDEWESLSIPVGASEAFNKIAFSEDQVEGHYTDLLTK